jgi:hypothetical protein
MTVQPLTSRPAFRRRKRADVDRALFEQHDAAVMRLRDALADLAVARAHGAPLPELRIRHAEVNRRFATSTAAAQRVYDAVIAALGGGRRAVNTPEGQRWDRIMNGLRTEWERQRMRQVDLAGALPPNAVRNGSRAPWAPHQAGTEFDPPHIAGRPLADPRIGVGFPAAIDAVPRPRT